MLKLSKKYKRIAVAVSGGIDSTVLLYDAIQTYGVGKVVPLHASYGQFTEQTNLSVFRKIEQDVGCKIQHVKVRLPEQLRTVYGRSSRLFSGEVSGKKAETMPDYLVEEYGYVPGLFTQIWANLVAVAMVNKCDVVLFGFHSSEDDKNFEFASSVQMMDCGQEFVSVLSQIGYAVWGPGAPALESPYEVLTKLGVFMLGIELGLEKLLLKTTSCDVGGCGTCFECKLRERAIEWNNNRTR